MALAHDVSNKVEEAYGRGDLFDRRRKVAGAGARYCATSSAGAIVPFPQWQANGVTEGPSMADTDEDELLALTTTERRALTRLLKRALDDDRFPLAPRLDPLRAILAQFKPPKPAPPLGPTKPPGH